MQLCLNVEEIIVVALRIKAGMSHCLLAIFTSTNRSSTHQSLPDMNFIKLAQKCRCTKTDWSHGWLSRSLKHLSGQQEENADFGVTH